MKTILISVAWAFVAGVVLFTALSPGGGVIYRNPMACLGLGLVGLGLCIGVRKREFGPVAAE